MEVQVEYNYTAEERDELTLKQGDIVTNVSQFEEGWYIGTFNGREGVFPDNFVRIIKSAPGHDSRPNVGDRHDKSLSSPVKLGGDGLKEVGDNNRNQMSSRALSPSTVLASLGNKASDYVKVAYAYVPERSDELELEVGDFIRVLSRDLPEEGWWRGLNIRTNKTGVFPDNFVKMADANDSEFKRVIADYKMKTTSATPRIAAQNSGSGVSSRALQNGSATSPTGSRRHDSDSRKRTDLPEGNPEDHRDRLASKSSPSKLAPSIAKTDARYSSKSDVYRSGRGETTTQKMNGGFSALNRKNSTTKPEYESSSAKASASKSRSSSLTRLDPSRSSEGTPRNMSDLQSQVHEQQERLDAVVNQLKKLGQTVDSIQREQREHNENIAGQLHELNKQLATVKTTQLNDQAGTAKNFKVITDRLRSLMLELDEVKKSRSNDEVELSRIKRVMLDLDNRTMFSSGTMNGAGEDYRARLPDLTDINGHNSCDPFPSTRSHSSSKPPTGP